MLNKVIIIILLCLTSITIIYAAPSVTGVSGTISAGQSITISGSGFGTKSTAAPLKWDTFENGTNGTLLRNIDATWQGYGGGTGVAYSNTSCHAGSLCLGHRNANLDAGGEDFTTNYFTYSPNTQELFVSYWWKVVPGGGTDDTIIKMTRLTSSEASGGGGIYNGPGGTSIGGTYDLSDTGTGPYCNHYPNSTETPCSGAWNTANAWNFPPNDTWFKVDFYKKLSTAGTANGIIYAKLFGTQLQNGDNELNNTAVMTRASGQTFMMDTVLLGIMDGSDAAHDYYIYIDDVYIDSTLSRVEICAESTWAARSHCEIQIPSAWSTSSATVTVNRGSFGASDLAYLYVVDSAGVANSSGYSVTFGSGSTPVNSVTGCSIVGGRIQ